MEFEGLPSEIRESVDWRSNRNVHRTSMSSMGPPLPRAALYCCTDHCTYKPLASAIVVLSWYLIHRQLPEAHRVVHRSPPLELREHRLLDIRRNGLERGLGSTDDLLIRWIGPERVLDSRKKSLDFRAGDSLRHRSRPASGSGRQHRRPSARMGKRSSRAQGSGMGALRDFLRWTLRLQPTMARRIADTSNPTSSAAMNFSEAGISSMGSTDSSC